MNWIEWLKIIVPLIGGGAAGALINMWVTRRRNSIQPIGREITVSYISVPRLMEGFDAAIILRSRIQGELRDFSFNQLATVQVQLINLANQDYASFDLSIDVPPGSTIMDVQYESEDQLHGVEAEPEASIENPSDHVLLTLTPFNRKDKYYITLVVNAAKRNLRSEIKLGKNLPIRFVDLEPRKTSWRSQPDKLIVLFSLITALLSMLVVTPYVFEKGSTILMVTIGIMLVPLLFIAAENLIKR